MLPGFGWKFLPDSHDMQSEAPVVDTNFPAGQAMHSAPVAEKYPALHLQQALEHGEPAEPPPYPALQL
jgi:hypothetical protein